MNDSASEPTWIKWSKQLMAIAQNGLAYACQGVDSVLAARDSTAPVLLGWRFGGFCGRRRSKLMRADFRAGL